VGSTSRSFSYCFDNHVILGEQRSDSAKPPQCGGEGKILEFEIVIIALKIQFSHLDSVKNVLKYDDHFVYGY